MALGRGKTEHSGPRDMARKTGHWGFTEEAKAWASRARRRDEKRALIDDAVADETRYCVVYAVNGHLLVTPCMRTGTGLWQGFEVRESRPEALELGRVVQGALLAPWPVGPPAEQDSHVRELVSRAESASDAAFYRAATQVSVRLEGDTSCRIRPWRRDGRGFVTHQGDPVHDLQDPDPATLGEQVRSALDESARLSGDAK